MKRTTALAYALAAISVVATSGWIVTAGRLADARDEIDSLEDRADTAESDLSVLSSDTQERESRIEKLNQLLDSAKAEVRRLEMATSRGCFQNAQAPNTSLRGPIKGDVDGDRRSDRVYTLGLASTRDACTFHVVIASGDGGMIGAPIRTAKHGVENNSLQFDLMPSMMVELNGVAGYEVLIQTGRGATGQSYEIFTFVDGSLQLMDRGGEHGWLFGTAASAGYGTSLDCLPDGRIIRSEYGYDDSVKDQRVERSFYSVSGARWFLQATETSVVKYGKEHRFPEFRFGDAAPFPSCENRVPAYRPQG